MSQSHVSTHALERSIRAMSTGAVLSLDKRRASEGYDQMQEIETQFQIPIWGLASSGIGWTKFNLVFDVEFMFAPQQRDSPLTVPHFSYGPVLTGEPSPNPAAPDVNNPDSLVGVFCQVIDWSRDHTRDIINGAVVGVGVTTLGGQDVDFTGYVHLTFQGFGSPAEQNTALDVGQ